MAADSVSFSALQPGDRALPPTHVERVAGANPPAPFAMAGLRRSIWLAARRRCRGRGGHLNYSQSLGGSKQCGASLLDIARSHGARGDSNSLGGPLHAQRKCPSDVPTLVAPLRSRSESRHASRAHRVSHAEPSRSLVRHIHRVLERDQHCGKLAAEEIAGVALSRSTSMRLSGTRACRSRLRR